MIGYLCPRIDGELFYSRIARSLALDGESTDEQRAARVLGRQGRDIGILLPSHVDALLSRLPTIIGVAEEEVFATSLFPAAIPVLEHGALEKLRRICRRSNPPDNMRCLSGQRQADRRLRFCLDCARGDLAAGRPLHWRAAHQHPGVTACAVHGTILIEAPTIQRAPYRIFFPNEWINPSAANPPVASPIERRIANDVAAVLTRSSLTGPGQKSLCRALHGLFHARPEYRCDSRSVQVDAVIDNLRGKHGDEVMARLGGVPDPRDLWNWVRCCLYSCNQVGIDRFTLLADLIDVSLKELFDLAESKPSQSRAPCIASIEVERAKQTISNYRAAHPTATRTTIYRGCGAACRLVRHAEPSWYVQNMPARKSQKYQRRTETSDYDEMARDRLLVAYKHIAATPMRVGRNNLLQGARLKRFASNQNIARLPKTWAALKSLIESDEEYSRRRAKATSTRLFERGEHCTFAQFKQKARLESTCRHCSSAEIAAKRAWEDLINRMNGPTLFELQPDILAA